jgi:hypothetical protein
MNTLLDEAIEAWEVTRNGVIAEVENIPADRFDFRPAPKVRSVDDDRRAEARGYRFPPRGISEASSSLFEARPRPERQAPAHSLHCVRLCAKV